MSDWWYGFAIAGLATGGGLYLLNRRTSPSRRSAVSAPAHRDYTRDREEARLAQMSEEDQA